MDRKEFLKKTIQCGVGSCLGLHMLTNQAMSATITKISELDITSSEDGFLKLFDWISHPLKGDISKFFSVESKEYKILTKIKDGWGKKKSIVLFTELTDEYGDDAIKTMRLFIKKCTIPYWSERGSKEAKNGKEIENFIAALWEPMGEEFVYSSQIENAIHKLKVSKCPFADLAEKTGKHEWVYNMACITDYYMTSAFSSEIGFSRSKTLTQSDECCNHTYYNPSKQKNKMHAYCGLYCGGCPSYQNTENYKPVDFKKEEFYNSCDGCNGNINAPWCKDCEIKKCARDKGVEICLDCEKYPCDKITTFINDEKYPYHKEVDLNMKRYKEIGLDNWLVEQDKKYLCKKCCNRFNFFQLKCDNCGATVN